MKTTLLLSLFAFFDKVDKRFIIVSAESRFEAIKMICGSDHDRIFRLTDNWEEVNKITNGIYRRNDEIS